MPKPMKIQDFLRIFGSYGVHIERSKGKPTHLKMSKVINGVKHIYIAVCHKNEVEGVYVSKARRRFKLLKDDGITDEDFHSK